MFTQVFRMDRDEFENGMTHFRHKRYIEAIQCYDRAIKINPEYKPAYNSKGLALYSLGRYAEALTSHEQALTLHPKCEYAHHGKGNALSHLLGRHEEALASYERALTLSGATNSGATKKYIHNSKGNLLLLLHRDMDALLCFQKELELKSTRTYHGLMHSVNEQIPTFLLPQTGYYFAKARQLFQLGAYAPALKELESAQKIASPETNRALIVPLLQRMRTAWGDRLRRQEKFELASIHYKLSLAYTPTWSDRDLDLMFPEDSKYEEEAFESWKGKHKAGDILLIRHGDAWEAHELLCDEKKSYLVSQGPLLPNDLLPIPLMRQNIPGVGEHLEIDVPADGTCLFYSLALSFLLPVARDPSAFTVRFDRLFGRAWVSLDAAARLREVLLTYRGEADFITRHTATLEVLVEVHLRQNIVRHMQENKEDKPGKPGFENVNYTEAAGGSFEAQMARMTIAKTWGGDREVEAVSQLLQRQIIVYGKDAAGQLTDARAIHGGHYAGTPLYLVHTDRHYHYLIAQQHLPATLSLPVIEPIAEKREKETKVTKITSDSPLGKVLASLTSSNIDYFPKSRIRDLGNTLIGGYTTPTAPSMVGQDEDAALAYAKKPPVSPSPPLSRISTASEVKVGAGFSSSSSSSSASHVSLLLPASSPPPIGIAQAVTSGRGKMKTLAKTEETPVQEIESRVGLADCQAHLEDLAGASENYKKVLRAQPSNLRALHNLGVTLRRLDELDEAIRHYEILLTINPDHTPTHFNLACIWLHKKQPDKAQAAFALYKEKKALCSCADEDLFYDDTVKLPLSTLSYQLQHEKMQLEKERFKRIFKEEQQTKRLLLKELAQYPALQPQSWDEEEVAERKNELSLTFTYLNPEALLEKKRRELFAAIEQGNTDKLRALREQKADLRMRDKMGNTGLHWAAIKGAGEWFFEFFKEAGCGVDDTNNQGETPLYAAVMQGRTRAVAHLVNNGADLTRTFGVEKQSIFAIALQTHQPVALIENLIYHIDINRLAAPVDVLPPLHLASHFGHVAALRHFITQKRADRNAADKKGVTPLAAAALAGQEEAVATLIELQVAFDDRTPAGESLLKNINDHVVDARVKEGINNRLINYAKAQRREVEVRGKLVNAIFLALFGDLFAAPEKEKPEKVAEHTKRQTALTTLIELAIGIAPASATSALDKLEKEAKGHPSLFKTFVTTRITYSKKKKDWVEVLVRENKEGTVTEQEQFKKELKTAIEIFADDSKAVWQDTLISKVLDDLKLDINTVKKLKEQIKKEFIHYPRVQQAVNDALLIDLLQKEIKHSVKDEVDIDSAHKQFYEFRIQGAFEAWLHHTDRLLNTEKITYETAHDIVEKLNKQCSGMKDKKIGLVRHLIKGILLEKSIVDPDGESMGRISLLEFIESISDEEAEPTNRIKRKKTLIEGFTIHVIAELTSDPKSYRMEKFSSDMRNYKAYGDIFKHHMSKWVTKKISMERNSVFRSDEEQKTEASSDPKEIYFNINKKEFITEFLTLFDLLFGKFNALDKEMVKRADEDIDKLGKTVEEHKEAFPKVKLFGFEISLGDLASACVHMGIYLKDVSVAKSARRMTDLFSLHNPFERNAVLQAAAEHFIERYRWQIERLGPKGAHDLARCAANRAVNYIIKSEGHQIKDEPGILDKVKGFILSNEPSKKKEFMGPLGVLVAGIYWGKCPELDGKKIKTHGIALPSVALSPASARDDMRPWTAEALIENTGIVVKDEINDDEHYYLHSNVLIGPTGEPLYGYRIGTEEEAKKLGYTLKPDKLSTALQFAR